MIFVKNICSANIFFGYFAEISGCLLYNFNKYLFEVQIMNRIRELRTQHKMTQAELASTMSCTKMTISRYESEQREIDSATINQVCDIFHVSADYLLCRSDVPDPYLSDEDAALLRAYHAAPDHIQTAIGSMLQLDEKEKPAAPEARAAG